MAVTIGYSDITNLYPLPFGRRLSLLTAQICEVYPAHPSPGGSRQQIRLADGRGGRIDVQLFDQESTIPTNAEGYVVRFSAHPSAKRAIVWEHSKAAKPTIRIGTLVVRAQAKVELFNQQQAQTAGITAFGIVVAEEPGPGPAAGAQPQPELPLTRAPSEPSQLPPVAPPLPSARASTGDSPAIRLAKCFSECLDAARAVLGPGASDSDVQATARATFDQLMSRRPAA